MSSKQEESINLRRVSIINGQISVTIDSDHIDNDTLIKLICIEIENEDLRKENARLQSEVLKLKEKQGHKPAVAAHQ